MPKNEQEMFHVKQGLFSEHNLDVSRETIDRLTQYEVMLKKWQKTINLVGPSTLDNIWDRHFLDSAALLQYLPKTAKTIYDIGSGAGFPGMVLSIMDPKRDYTLIESDQRKCSFLRSVSRETSSTATICNKRIESSGLMPPDVFVARALGELGVLFELIEPVYDVKKTTCVFLKGSEWEKEVVHARKNYNFDISVHKNGDKGGVILCINNIKGV